MSELTKRLWEYASLEKHSLYAARAMQEAATEIEKHAELIHVIEFQIGLIDQLHFVTSEYPEHSCGTFTEDLKGIADALRKAMGSE